MHRPDQDPPLRPRAATPAPRLGILGGGQLAKMTAAAAAQLGCEVVVLERQEDFPAHSLDTHAIIGDWNDPRQLLRLAPLVDVVTLENEFVDTAALAALADQGHRLWPALATVALVQDKLSQKQAFAAAGLPVPRFADAPTPDAVRRFGLPAVLKKRRNSYDGKGNATVREATELPDAWARLDGGREALYVEEFCEFTMELAIIITRGQDGAVARYPVVETINRDHICHVVRAPAAAPADVASAAADIARQAIEAIDGVGAFGMELFLRPDGGLLINEIAPRVHNSGHYTIEACACSQFENHVRAVMGWPLGSPSMRAPAAAMINLLGAGDGPGAPVGLAAALAVPGAHLHIYGKTRSARGRKMGHVTALGATPEEALASARRAADQIRFGGEA
jgi:5-(carboxyamino)imidazole ribonucleotide synthase